MATFSRTWNSGYEGTPADGDDVSEGALRIRNLKEDTRERLEIDHSWSGDGDDGQHKQVTLQQLGSDPSTKTDRFRIYAKEADGDVELFFKNDQGQVFQITSGGRLLLDGSNDSDSFVRSDAADTITASTTWNTGGNTNTAIDEDGIDRSSGSSETFNIQNSGSGSMELQVDGNKAMHTDNGGAGSGFDADLLDGEEGGFYNDVPDGTRVVFYQANAPTGYTQVTGVDDQMLRVVDGEGGGTGGDWQISGISVDGHALTVSEMPSHDHGSGNLSTNSTGAHTHDFEFVTNEEFPSGNGWLTIESDSTGLAVDDSSTSPDVAANSVKSNGSHSHNVNSGTTGDSGGDAEHTHGLTADGAWRPAYINVIVCTRNKP